MKGMVGAVVLGSLLAASAPGAAEAQARGYLGLGGGVTIPMGSFKNGYKAGWVGQVIGGVKLNDMFGVRVNGGYGQNSGKTVGTTTAPKVKLVHVLADVTLSPKTSGNIAPYILAGAGMVNSKATVAGTSGSSSAFTWNAGAGASIKAGSVGVYLEARFQSSKKGGATTNLLPITFGVRFGGG